MGPLAALYNMTNRAGCFIWYCALLWLNFPFHHYTWYLIINKDFSHCCSLVWYGSLILVVIFLFVHTGICAFLTLPVFSVIRFWSVVMSRCTGLAHQADEWILRKLRLGYYCLKWLIQWFKQYDQIDINQDEWKEFVSSVSSTNYFR